MDRLLYLLPLLACPAAMGLVMWGMMRGGRSTAPGHDQPAPGAGRPTPPGPDSAEVARLRAEVAALRARVEGEGADTASGQ